MGIHNVLFDLDGTLSDPGAGILRSIDHALRALGHRRNETDLRWCVGPPLREIFARLMSPLDNPAEVERAVQLYIDHYAGHGALECKPYEGVRAMLARMSQLARLFVVTSKNTAVAEQILTALGLRGYFVKVIGLECDARFKVKADAVRFIIDSERMIRSETAMVGDREHDVIAGRTNGIVTIGMTYGYGTCAELIAAGADELCDCPAEVAATLRRLSQ
ncbi:MAG: HAD hydrolase-like protein [Candidatus Binataceae bacterium]